jgi:hypothetical protein
LVDASRQFPKIAVLFELRNDLIGDGVSLLSGDEAAFPSAAGDVNSSLKASRAHAVAIWRKAKRAAPSRLSTAHWPQSFDNLQQFSADDVITPKRAARFSAIKSITGAKCGQ